MAGLVIINLEVLSLKKKNTKTKYISRFTNQV